MTQRGSETVTYDILNKPTRITGTTTSDFVYDADHQLVKQIVNGVTTVYLGNVEIILEGLTTTTSTYIDGAIQYRYFNNGVKGAGGEYHYLHRDPVGDRWRGHVVYDVIAYLIFGIWSYSVDKYTFNWNEQRKN